MHITFQPQHHTAPTSCHTSHKITKDQALNHTHCMNNSYDQDFQWALMLDTIKFFVQFVLDIYSISAHVEAFLLVHFQELSTSLHGWLAISKCVMEGHFCAFLRSVPSYFFSSLCLLFVTLLVIARRLWLRITICSTSLSMYMYVYKCTYMYVDVCGWHVTPVYIYTYTPSCPSPAEEGRYD